MDEETKKLLKDILEELKSVNTNFDNLCRAGVDLADIESKINDVKSSVDTFYTEYINSLPKN